jgi:hypothetical protein
MFVGAYYPAIIKLDGGYYLMLDEYDRISYQEIPLPHLRSKMEDGLVIGNSNEVNSSSMYISYISGSFL